MSTDRMEAFSDGVIAILITILVLELKVPHGTDWSALKPLVPVAATYVMSFIYLGIYWNNHHHLLRLTEHVSGGILWANLHLLFWLSLLPFATGWMGQNHFAQIPTAAYGIVLLAAALAWLLLQTAIVRKQGSGSKLREAIGSDVKGKLSALLYVLAIGLALANTWLANAIYLLVAAIWLVPDRRMESHLRRGAD